MRSPMPVGNPTLITNIQVNDAFGFFYASILVPDNKQSLVPHRIEFCEIEYPNNQFTGWYFSEELKVLEKLGYKIKLHDGYQFEVGYDIFKHFSRESLLR